jgi:uncharacterized protein Yka (UPF0111/DUF47 family)
VGKTKYLLEQLHDEEDQQAEKRQALANVVESLCAGNEKLAHEMWELVRGLEAHADHLYRLTWLEAESVRNADRSQVLEATSDYVEFLLLRSWLKWVLSK